MYFQIYYFYVVANNLLYTVVALVVLDECDVVYVGHDIKS